MILSRHDSVCLAQELGEESPGWPIRCLAVPRAMRVEHLEAKCNGCCDGESARGDLSGRPPPRLSLRMILSRHDSVCLAQEFGEESPGWPIKCLAVPRATRVEHLEAKCSGCGGGESARGDLSGRPPRLSLSMILSRHDSVCLAQELGDASLGWPMKCLTVPRAMRVEHLEAECSGCGGGESARGDLSGRPPQAFSLHDSVPP
jgi:hypothetical protein